MSRQTPGPFNNDFPAMGFIGGLFPEFPDEKWSIVQELRERVKRLAGQPGRGPDDYIDIGDNLVVWWLAGEIGLARRQPITANRLYEPVLIVPLHDKMPRQPMEWGSYEEIDQAMDQLRKFMVLDDMIQG